jgi:hypothetical protein
MFAQCRDAFKFVGMQYGQLGSPHFEGRAEFGYGATPMKLPTTEVSGTLSMSSDLHMARDECLVGPVWVISRRYRTATLPAASPQLADIP